ncbi:hypothetical protein N7507_007108 [Penicillium longicatenatum]|nr:hypothetical protein N7507_007108 [Penicillium longicatenatum]
MSDGDSAPSYEAPAVIISNNGIVAVAADVQNQDEHDPTSPKLGSKKRDFVDQLSRQPSFLEHLADSRNSQFPVQDRGEIERYFHGPRDMTQHSKWPIVMRLQGSIMPQMILPLLLVGSWATLITCISHFYHNCIWADGRKYWASLIQTSCSLSRIIWVHFGEREGEEEKVDILRKRSAMNLILAFSVALKHKLRFEPDVAYENMAGLIAHLDTFAIQAHDRSIVHPPSSCSPLAKRAIPPGRRAARGHPCCASGYVCSEPKPRTHYK